ncbi:Fc.00g026880.m01.CDS01 [Cosmosporella sp. VM-42]
MRWQPATSLIALATLIASVSAGRSLAHVGKRDRDVAHAILPRGVPHDIWSRSSKPAKQYYNSKTAKFAINGTAIPDVDFDIGEAYAGTLPNTEDPDSEYYFWFQPSRNPAAKKEIVIWLNGGPGCSSLEGFLQENGPFLWQYGTFKPVANPWAWHHLTNMVWVEQPVGTGFSTGNITAKDEADIARQFMGFWKNFVKTFTLQGYKVYISGESYAGMYCPYIASAMLDTKDKTYFDVKGMLIYDPSISAGAISEDITAVPFVEQHRNLFPFNSSFVDYINHVDKKCGYAALRDKYLTYPPPGHMPSTLPGTNPKTGEALPGCDTLWNDIVEAVMLLNPCFDLYQVATTCPLLWDVLGFPGSFDYLPEGASIYFNRADVKEAINAPHIEWAECSEDPVFVNNTDLSEASANTVLGGVVDRTKNVMIAHGLLDFVLIANGTLMAIQNMTFGGHLGFQKPPTEPFYVPYHHAGPDATLAGAGIFGQTITERGLTYVSVELSGHMVPQYAPSAAYRQLEVLLGRVKSLKSKQPFTTDKNVPQPK